MKTKNLLRASFSLALLLASAPAAAGDTEQARALFEAGARAYKAGDYRAAIQAFEQAHRADARPNILFSIAQAHRRQYVLDRRPGHVAVAIKLYRDYLAQVPQGGRRADAVAALGELAPVAAQLERDGQLQPIGVAESGTRLVVSSASDGATVVLDGKGDEKAAPLIAEVSPGKHVIHLRAPGFADEQREIEVPAGGVTALDIPLRELPAQVAIGGLRGAEVSVDGKSVGAVPFASPIAVAPGKRLIRWSKSGHVVHEEVVDLGRGAKVTVAAKLPRTVQRNVSYGLLGAGAAAGATGAVLGILAAVEQGTASRIKGDITGGKVVCRGATCPELDDFNHAVEARNRLRAASGAVVGIGVAAAAAGALLYFLDAPKAAAGPRADEAPNKAPPPREVPIDVAVGSGFVGATVTIRF